MNCSQTFLYKASKEHLNSTYEFPLPLKYLLGVFRDPKRGKCCWRKYLKAVYSYRELMDRRLFDIKMVIKDNVEISILSAINVFKQDSIYSFKR